MLWHDDELLTTLWKIDCPATLHCQAMSCKPQILFKSSNEVVLDGKVGAGCNRNYIGNFYSKFQKLLGTET